MNARAYKRTLEVVQYPQLKIAYKNTDLFNSLISKKDKIAVIGLGYVGLPLALHMAEIYKVIGFDINESKVEKLKHNIDPCNEMKKDDFYNRDIGFVSEEKILSEAKFFIVAVPTPINEDKEPDLAPLRSATKIVARSMSKGSIIVFESTVFPGCTEEVCVPILEQESGLKFNEDFYVGYSPERINPGDKVNTFKSITKIVSGSTKEALEIIGNVYEEVLEAGIFKASCIKVAEAAKIVENTQRDVNIALMNELTYIFDNLGIGVNEVLSAASTKWNFLKFFPGLVGGHCIGVDPYYLIHKANEINLNPSLIKSARDANERMSSHIGLKIMKRACTLGKHNRDIKILVKGITFKENVSDIRNSKVIDMVELLQSFDYQVFLEDPYADPEEVKKIYRLKLGLPDKKMKFDVVVMAVNHNVYHQIENMENLITKNGFLFDVRGSFKNLIESKRYMAI